jgi:phosphoglycerol transferase MdoB-like AlkP superfamily enzyme
VHWKKILISTLAGGMILALCQVIFTQVANAVDPYDMLAIGGMRSPTDPVMLLFFAYPLVLAFTASLVFDLVEKALKGRLLQKGIGFGVILFLLVTLPSLFVIYTSMEYPAGFYIANILTGVIGFPLLGYLYAWIWARDR